MVVVCGDIHMGCEDFSHHTRFETGVRDKVKFWHDWWGGDQPLRIKFPVLYRLAINKEASIALSLTRLKEGEKRT